MVSGDDGPGCGQHAANRIRWGRWDSNPLRLSHRFYSRPWLYQLRRSPAGDRGDCRGVSEPPMVPARPRTPSTARSPSVQVPALRSRHCRNEPRRLSPTRTNRKSHRDRIEVLDQPVPTLVSCRSWRCCTSKVAVANHSGAMSSPEYGSSPPPVSRVRGRSRAVEHREAHAGPGLRQPLDRRGPRRGRPAPSGSSGAAPFIEARRLRATEGARDVDVRHRTLRSLNPPARTGCMRGPRWGPPAPLRVSGLLGAAARRGSQHRPQHERHRQQVEDPESDQEPRRESDAEDRAEHAPRRADRPRATVARSTHPKQLGAGPWPLATRDAPRPDSSVGRALPW